MNDDSKKKILEEWNSKKLEKQFPWQRLVFDNFNELYRFLKEQSSEQGKQNRKNKLDRFEEANIRFPKSFMGMGNVKHRKKEGKNLITTSLMFLQRIRALKKIDKEN
ncbi:MAG: hypothetical protein WAV15_01180 [Minisyncoccia bacterium]